MGLENSSSTNDREEEDQDFDKLEGGITRTAEFKTATAVTTTTTVCEDDDDENCSAEERNHLHAPILVEVEAPATLAGGYVFWATTTPTTTPTNDSYDEDIHVANHSCESSGSVSTSNQPISFPTSFPVTVPPGGVLMGETLRVPLLARLDECGSYDCLGVCHSDSEDDSNSSSHGPAISHRSSTTTTTTGSRSVFREMTHYPPLADQQPGTETLHGKWKDGVCSCFRLGFCHPHLWNACLCPQILLGQILVRTNLFWLYHHLREPKSHGNSPPSLQAYPTIPWSFRIILCLVLVCGLYDALYAPPLLDISIDEGTGQLVWSSRLFGMGVSSPTSSLFLSSVWWDRLICLCLTLPMSVWGLVVVVRLRRSIRERYNIPPSELPVSYSSCRRSSPPSFLCKLSLGRWEDLVCGLCCSCCAISQMARQTADYEGTEAASCCSANGLRHNNNSNNNGTNAPAAALPTNNANSSGRKTGWWFRNRCDATREVSARDHGAPHLSSVSVWGGNPHLRYRSLSSSSSYSGSTGGGGTDAKKTVECGPSPSEVGGVGPGGGPSCPGSQRFNHHRS